MSDISEVKAFKRIEFLLVFLWLSISAWVERAAIAPVLDSIAQKTIRMSFSHRSEKIQLFLILGLSFVISLFIFRFLQLQKRKTIHGICLLLCFACIGHICALQTIRRDDYWEIHDAAKYGFPGFITFEYLYINGRYFSLFLKSLYQFVRPTLYINILLFLTFVLLWKGCTIMMRQIMSGGKKTDVWTAGMCMAFGIIFMSPNIWEVWFWGGGTLIYGIGIALTVTAAALMISIEKSSEHLTRKTVLAAVCIFCACGTSELNTASVCAFSFMIFLFPRILLKRRWNKRNGLLFFLACLITLIILLTSGDFRDAASLSGRENDDFLSLLLLLPESVILAVKTLAQHFYSRIEFVLLFTAISMMMGFCSARIEISVKMMTAVVIGLFLTAVGTLTINFMIGFIPPRVISIPLDWILLALMLPGFFAASQLRQRSAENADVRVISALIPLISLTLVFCFYRNNIGRISDIRRAWIERDRVLLEMNGSEVPVKTCAIPVMGSLQADPSNDPDRDFNIVTAYYYGFPSITADRLCSPFNGE